MLSEEPAPTLWGGPHDGLEVRDAVGQPAVYVHQGLMSATTSFTGGPGDGFYAWDEFSKRFEWMGVIQ